MYKPLLEIVPQAAPEQPEPETLQFTAVLLVPLTVAVNCCIRVTPTEVVPLGVILTLIPP